MIEPSLDRSRGILVLELSGPQQALDTVRICALLDPYLAEAGRLRGLLVDTRRAPGWADAEALLAEERFLLRYLPVIDRVAFVTDSDLIAALARLATRGASPIFRRFPWRGFHEAMAWLEEG
jgi:hypothetical protein